MIFLQFIYSSRKDEITKKSLREVKIRKITIRVDNKSKKKNVKLIKVWCFLHNKLPYTS